MYVTNKIKKIKKHEKKEEKKSFLQNRYPIMVNCLNIGKNIGKPIYRSIPICLYC